MTIQDLMHDLKLEKVPACFTAYYETVKDNWKERAQQILSEAYISKTFADCGVLTQYEQTVLEAARQLQQSDALCLWVCLLEKWLQEGGIDTQQYQSPAGSELAYDFLHLFPAIPTMNRSVAFLRDRNVPEDVIADTISEYDYCVELCRKNLGHPVFDFGRLVWISRLVGNRFIRIGRLKYDLPDRYLCGIRVYRDQKGQLTMLADGMLVHRSGGVLGSAGMNDPEGSFLAQIQEKEEFIIGYSIVSGLVQKETCCLDKRDWTLCLSEEDAVLRIHIPPDGGFDKKTIASSFQRARQIFERCYPDFPYKAFFCKSWLLSPQLGNILKPDSNIIAFQDHFIRVPCKSGGRSCLNFLFGPLSGVPKDFSGLPENTSLQRAVKKLYLNGDCLHDGAGFFF